MTLFIDLFWLVTLVLGAPVIAWKFATKPRWRVGLPERFGLRVPVLASDRPVIWVHAVSVGEVHAARPLVRELEAALPGHDVVISAITSTGLEVARKHLPRNRSFFYPVDLSFAVRRLLDAVRPRMIVLVELELWPNLLANARARGIPVVVVNGRMSERSARRYGLVPGLVTRPVAEFCAQSEEHARRFLALGVPESRILVTGNLKYDTSALEAVGDAPAEARELRARLGIAPGAPVIVAGSTHGGEELACALAWRALRPRFPGLRLVIAPRHLERIAGVLLDLGAAGVSCVRKTALVAGAGAGACDDVILVDTMGELSRLYLVADVVFVGGSLVPHGGQNMLEPAALGKPALFGPHVRNFQAIANELTTAGGAERIPDAAALEPALGRLLEDGARARAMGERAAAFVAQHRGAARRTVEVLTRVLRAHAG